MDPITDEDSARAWLKTQDHQTQIWFATRCALRALPGVGLAEDASKGDLAFGSLRAMLISAAAATCPAAEMKGLKEAASSAADSTGAALAADSDAYHSASAARYAARSAAHSATDPFYSAANFASATVADSAGAASGARSAAAYSAAYSAADADARAAGDWPMLWHDAGMPDGFAQGWEALEAYFEADPKTWGFWHRWYKAILNGTPLPWDLSFRIATELSEGDWDQGPEHVAQEIARIEEEWNADRSEEFPRASALEPSNVSFLWDHAPAVSMNLASTGQSVALAFEAFRSEARPNETPEMLKALEAIPGSFARIEAILRKQKSDAEDAALKQEIGRLNAKVAALEVALADARAMISTLETENRALQAKDTKRKLPAWMVTSVKVV